MGTSEEKAISTISQRTKYQNYAFKKKKKTPSRMVRHARAQSYISARTHACKLTQAHAHMQSQSTGGDYNISPLSQIRQDQIISLL